MEDARKLLEVLYDRRDAYVGWDELACACLSLPARGEQTGQAGKQASRAEAGLEARRLNSLLDFLRQRGHRFDSAAGVGIKLAGPVRLDAWLIDRGLAVERVGRCVVCFDSVGSTNDVAFASAWADRADGLVVLAEYQTGGRGRPKAPAGAGGKWLSEPGQNVLMSVLLIDDEQRLPRGALTIAAGLAAAEGIEAACGLPAELKWPNDVLLDGAKVAGVLVESRDVDGRPAVVVGIGMNANQCPPPEAVPQPATSLAEQLGRPVERTELVRQVISSLDGWVAKITSGSLDELADRWRGRCCMLGRRVAVRCGRDVHVGRVLDVSPLDELVIADDGGCRLNLPAGGSTVLSSDLPGRQAGL